VSVTLPLVITARKTRIPEIFPQGIVVLVILWQYCWLLVKNSLRFNKEHLMKRKQQGLIAGLAVLGLLAAACSSDGESSVTEAPVATDAPTVTDAPVVTEPNADGDLVQWALDYTEGTAGMASGDSIKIGYVNQEDYFPENTIGVNAAVEFINNELGGAAGHPLEIVPCNIAVAEDGAKCGTEFANNADITAVLTGTILVGNKELYDALNTNKPVIVGNGVTSDDFTTAAGSAFTAGSPGVVAGMAGFVVSQLGDVKNVAIIAANNAAGVAGADLLFKPVIEKAGIAYTFVGVDDTATAADVASAMTAVGADSADVVVLIVTLQQCINVYDASKALGIDPVIVATGLCFGTPMTDHLAEAGDGGTVPNNWYFGGYGYSYLPEQSAEIWCASSWRSES
jgi:branched-chain amino acid transport system substrate-binding protein